MTRSKSDSIRNLSAGVSRRGFLGAAAAGAAAGGFAQDMTVLDVLKNPAIAAEIKKRSEEHTSELQSLVNLVCRLPLEKKKNIKQFI